MYHFPPSLTDIHIHIQIFQCCKYVLTLHLLPHSLTPPWIKSLHIKRRIAHLLTDILAVYHATTRQRSVKSQAPPWSISTGYTYTYGILSFSYGWNCAYKKANIYRCAATHPKANMVMIMTKVTVSWSDFCETMLLQIILFFHFIWNDLSSKQRISEQIPYYDVLSAFCRKEDCRKIYGPVKEEES